MQLNTPALESLAKTHVRKTSRHAGNKRDH